MSGTVKARILELLENIDDEAVLHHLMEEISFYASKKDIVDELDQQQLKDLDEAIEEVDNNETTSLADFKKEMNEWKKG